MNSTIEFIPEAAADYRALDGSVRKKVDKKIAELAANPFAGERLGNKMGLNLSGFYKIYVDNRRIRIVYRMIHGSVEIVEIWGIGKRERAEIYRLISSRLFKREKE